MRRQQMLSPQETRTQTPSNKTSPATNQFRSEWKQDKNAIQIQSEKSWKTEGRHSRTWRDNNNIVCIEYMYINIKDTKISSELFFNF